jgi:hypothetical protein
VSTKFEASSICPCCPWPDPVFWLSRNLDESRVRCRGLLTPTVGSQAAASTRRRRRSKLARPYLTLVWQPRTRICGCPGRPGMAPSVLPNIEGHRCNAPWPIRTPQSPDQELRGRHAPGHTITSEEYGKATCRLANAAYTRIRCVLRRAAVGSAALRRPRPLASLHGRRSVEKGAEPA